MRSDPARSWPSMCRAATRRPRALQRGRGYALERRPDESLGFDWTCSLLGDFEGIHKARLSLPPRLLLRRLRLQRGHVGVAQIEILLQLLCLFQQSVRHFDKLLEYAAMLLTEP